MDIKKFLDQEGLAYLWKKLSLQDYPNNDTLVAIINAIDENKANKTDIKQSDWEQTDEEAIDFIKNKPDENDALSLLTELDFVTAATNEDEAIFIDEGNSIYGLTEENQGYAFKRLSEVDTIEEASDNLNILVENNGEIVKIAANSIKSEDALTREDVSELAISGSWNDMVDKPFYKYVQKGNTAMGEIPESTVSTSGQTVNGFICVSGGFQYIIYFDGELYICKTVIIGNGFDGVSYLGNLSLCGVGEDNGMPFCLVTERWAHNEAKCYITDESISHTIIAFPGSIETKFLDDEYISDNIARAEDILPQQLEIFEINETDYLGRYFSAIQQAHANGKIIIIKFTSGEQEYITTNVQVTETGYSFNFIMNSSKIYSANYTDGMGTAAADALEFSRRKLPSWNAANAGSEAYYPSIKAMEEYVSEVLSSDSMKVQSDWNQNDPEAADYVKNRTHYKTISAGTLYCECDFNEENFTIENQNGAYGAIMPFHNFDDRLMVVVNSVKYLCEGQWSGTDCYWGNVSLCNDEYASFPDTGEPFCIKYSGANYFYALTKGEYSVSVYKAETEITPISTEFLPTTVPVIPTATAGQAVVVKAVDADGKPTEWETIEYTASNIGADASGTAATAVSNHNVATDAHNDIRDLITGLTTRLNALADSDDTTLDQLSEIVAYIKSNKTLIENVTTNKVNVSDIVDNLTTNVSNKPLSAAQGVALKALIDAITIPSKLSDLAEDSTHRTVTDTEKTTWNAKSNFSGSYNDLTNKPTNVSAFTNDAGYITGYTETDPTVPAWAKEANKPTYSASEVGAYSKSEIDSMVFITIEDIDAICGANIVAASEVEF